MESDPIIEEIRAIRADFAKRHGYDIDAMVNALQQESARQGHQLVTLPPRSVEDEESGFRKAG